jgi:hypothetical protein
VTLCRHPLHLDDNHHEERQQHHPAQVEGDHGEPDHCGVVAVELRDLLSGHGRRHRRDKARECHKGDQQHRPKDRGHPQADQLSLDVAGLGKVLGLSKNLHCTSALCRTVSAASRDTGPRCDSDPP